MDIKGIDYLGMDRLLKRGSGEIIVNTNNAFFIRDTISEAYMLACEDEEEGIAILDDYADTNCNLLMVSNNLLGQTAFERYRFLERLECYQVAYYGEEPSIDTELSLREAVEHDIPMLIENYQMISPDELAAVVRRKSLLLGYYHDNLIGFIGEHLEGSMGLLYVFPEYRHRGFGASLQNYLIAKTMKKGFIPFGQVEKDNHNSIRLQEKIGMTRSDNLIVWMWK